MKIDVKGIIEGIKNKHFVKEELRELVESTYNERLAICEECEFIRKKGTSKAYCGKCGCNLSLKGRCLSCVCPITKWDAIMAKEIAEEIKSKLRES